MYIDPDQDMNVCVSDFIGKTIASVEEDSSFPCSRVVTFTDGTMIAFEAVQVDPSGLLGVAVYLTAPMEGDENEEK